MRFALIACRPTPTNDALAAAELGDLAARGRGTLLSSTPPNSPEGAEIATARCYTLARAAA